MHFEQYITRPIKPQNCSRKRKKARNYSRLATANQVGPKNRNGNMTLVFFFAQFSTSYTDLAQEVQTHGAMRECHLTCVVVCIDVKTCDVREENVKIRSEIYIKKILEKE